MRISKPVQIWNINTKERELSSIHDLQEARRWKNTFQECIYIEWGI